MEVKCEPVNGFDLEVSVTCGLGDERERGPGNSFRCSMYPTLCPLPPEIPNLLYGA